MAASAASTALTVSGSTSLDMSTLSSKSAFGSSCSAMQAAPVSRRAVRSGVVMASVGSEVGTVDGRHAVGSLNCYSLNAEWPSCGI